MLALSYRQPWCWALLHAGKDLENRRWRRRIRGPVLIHASQGCTLDEYGEAAAFIEDVCGKRPPHLNELPRGGFCGVLTFTGELLSPAPDVDWFGTGCCSNDWHMHDQWGYRVRDARELPFVPYKGMLGLFDVPIDAFRGRDTAEWERLDPYRALYEAA